MTTALLVIDAQNVYTRKPSELWCEDTGTTIRKINKLIEAFDDRGWPIILVRHVHRADGSDLGRMFDYTGEAEEDFNFKAGTPEVEYDERLIRPKSVLEVTKTRYGAFEGTDLDDKLRRLRADTVVICGFMTNFCCDSTARTAHDRDYFVDFIVDATGTPGTEKLDQGRLRRFVAQCLSVGYALVSATQEYLGTLKGKR